MKYSTRLIREMFKRIGDDGRSIYPHFIKSDKELERYRNSSEMQERWPYIVYRSIDGLLSFEAGMKLRK